MPGQSVLLHALLDHVAIIIFLLDLGLDDAVVVLVLQPLGIDVWDQIVCILLAVGSGEAALVLTIEQQVAQFVTHADILLSNSIHRSQDVSDLFSIKGESTSIKMFLNLNSGSAAENEAQIFMKVVLRVGQCIERVSVLEKAALEFAGLYHKEKFALVSFNTDAEAVLF